MSENVPIEIGVKFSEFVDIKAKKNVSVSFTLTF